MILNNLQDWQWYGIINSGQSFTNFFKSKVPVTWTLQDASGDVATATNPAVPLGRELSPLVFSAYSGGPEWSNLGNEVAHCDGSQSSSSALNYFDDNFVAGRTYNLAFTLSNRVSGSVAMYINGEAAIPSKTVDDSYAVVDFPVTLQATQRIFFLASDDFVGDIDLKIVSVKQTDILADTSYPGAEEITDPTFSNWSGGTLVDWTVTLAGTSSITELVNGVRLSGGDQLSRPLLREDTLIIGVRYQAIINVDNLTATDSLGVGHSTDVSFYGLISSSGQTTIEFTAVNTVFLLGFVNNSGSGTCDLSLASVKPANPFNGDVTGAGIVSGFTGNLARNFDGATDFINNYSAEHNSYFNPDAGTLITFAKVRDASVWTDGANRYFNILKADSSNLIRGIKSATNNTIVARYLAGGTAEDISTTILGSVTDWFMVAITWEKPGNFTLYINGVQAGTPQAIAGTWVGNLSATEAVIGASITTPSNVWDGDISYVGLSNVAMTPAEILNIYNRSGI
jgi:hypothetical protein